MGRLCARWRRVEGLLEEYTINIYFKHLRSIEGVRGYLDRLVDNLKVQRLVKLVKVPTRAGCKMLALLL